MKVVLFDGGRLSRYTIPAIEAQGYTPEVVVCTEETTMATTLVDLFSGPAFLTVEHDIEAPMGALSWLAHCPDPWCFHAYGINGRTWDEVCEVGGMAGWFAPLGLTRFRPEPLREILAPLLCDPRFCETWVSRDTLISRALADAGITPHRHYPDAIHHHDYQRDPARAADPWLDGRLS